MSPSIAETVIRRFTRPGDLVLDPFCGGGTTAVEALVSGRSAICADLSALAVFLTRAKARPLLQDHIDDLRKWLDKLGDPSQTLSTATPEAIVTKSGLIYSPKSYGLLRGIAKKISSLEFEQSRTAAKLMVLRTGQIAFDSREKPITPTILGKIFQRTAVEFLSKHEAYSQKCKQQKPDLSGQRRLTTILCDAEHLANRIRHRLKHCSLVLTSPPYPGIHVLYHRWQIRGRKEVALPFELLGLQDGYSEAHYTLAPRSEFDNAKYFERITRVFSAINKALSPSTPIVQVVAFSRPEIQLPLYLEAMDTAGLKPALHRKQSATLVKREIPNARWYVRTDPTLTSRKEYVLIHKSTS